MSNFTFKSEELKHVISTDSRFSIFDFIVIIVPRNIKLAYDVNFGIKVG